jgi:hypothetical protein
LKDGARSGRQAAREIRELKATLGEVSGLLERRDALLRELDSLPKEPGAGPFDERLGRIFEAQRLQDLAREKMFPPDPPNHFCRHAVRNR